MANHEVQDLSLMVGPEIASAMADVILNDSEENRAHLSGLRDQLAETDLTPLRQKAEARTASMVAKILHKSRELEVVGV